MVDTVNSLAARLHEVLVEILTKGAPVAGTRGLHDVIARAGALGPDGAWLAASGHANLAGLACMEGRADLAILHLEAAVAGGFNDCVSLHTPPVLPLHHDPRFQALYRRMRVTQADLDEFFWAHQEMGLMMRDAQRASVDNLGRYDSGVSLLPQAPLPTREPDTVGVLITRVDLAAAQTALQQAAVKADFQRASGNNSLSLIDDTWDYARARRDAWDADVLDSQRLRVSEARAFVERPGADTTLTHCPPLGSIRYPA
ncbi:hypothetical protein GCM10009639_50140 [Kitasatospora putterlickiae]|uniref:Uncharacterized protein n=1 Tax=Kitasatospora putterlickiae TaxID=221725 RepID=A0ABP4J0M3_9ACTN